MNWLSLFSFLGVVVTVAPVQAQIQCFERDTLKSYLKGEYADKPVSAGIVDNGHLMEVFSSPKNDLWVIVMTSPGKTSCVMATGQKWRVRLSPLPRENL